MKLRTHLIILVVTALVPLLIFAGVMVVLFDRQQRANVENQTINTSRALSLAVDREVAAWTGTLDALGASKDLDSGNLTAFREEAARVLKTREDWFNILLADSEGRQLLNLLRPLGSPLPSVKELEQFQRAIKTSQPVISDLFLGRVSGRHLLNVSLRVARDGKIRYVLLAAASPNALLRILSEQHIAPEWIGTIVDRKGIVIARTQNFRQSIGKPAMALSGAQTGGMEEGSVRGTTEDGTEVQVAFHRSELTGWTVRLAIPVSVLEAPLRRSLLYIVAGGVLLLVVGMTLAIALGRRIAAPIAGLAAAAEALGRGETAKIVASPIVEVNDVGRAIEDAGISRNRAEEKIQQNLERIRALYEIEVAIASTMDLKTRLDILLEKIELFCPFATAAGVRLPDKQGGTLMPLATRNMPLEEWRDELSHARGHITRQLMETKTYVTISNVLKDPRVSIGAFLQRRGLVSYLAIPLVVEDELIGNLDIYTGEEHDFTGEEIEFTTTLAGQAAIAIHNSRLFSKIMEQAASLAVTNERLQQAEKKYRNIFDNAVEGIFQSTPEGRYITANRALASMLGYESPEELMATITDIPNQLYLEHGRRREFQRLLEQFDVARNFETEVYRKDGSKIWISMNARAVRSADGALLYYEGTVEDITERKWARAELQQYARGLVNVSRRLLQAQETERHHLSRELHDEIGQALTALKINIQANLQAVEALPAAGALKTRITENIGIVEQLLQQVRGLALDLRPAILDDLGLMPALRWYLDHRMRQAGIDAQLTADPPDIHVRPDTATACFRIVQEALTNVTRHAQAKRVWVQLRQLNGRLDVTISDDGVGFDARAARENLAHGEGLGLLGMEERAQLVGGRIEIKSEPAKGTEIYVSLPLEPKPGSPEAGG